MTAILKISDYIAAFPSLLPSLADALPWELTTNATEHVRALQASLPEADYLIRGDVAVHRSSEVEAGAIVKGPAIIGPGCFVGAGSLLRGGIWLEGDCIIGQGAELKSSFMLAGSKLAHFNFVGDSLIGRDVNLEAGSVVANYRNERADKEIIVRIGKELVRTGCNKFGAVLGDGSRVGANAVLAPGALLAAGGIVTRLSLLDQERD
jgi:NDP-sugar pyrophosphorylase family protein